MVFLILLDFFNGQFRTIFPKIISFASNSHIFPRKKVYWEFSPKKLTSTRDFLPFFPEKYLVTYPSKHAKKFLIKNSWIFGQYHAGPPRVAFKFCPNDLSFAKIFRQRRLLHFQQPFAINSFLIVQSPMGSFVDESSIIKAALESGGNSDKFRNPNQLLTILKN
jgi:hypothetical protein